MTKTKIKAITLDVWSTLLRTKSKKTRQKILDYIEKNLGKEYVDTLFDRTITKKQFLREFKKIAGESKTKKICALINRHVKNNFIEYSDVKNMLYKLKQKKYKIGIISNASFITTEILKNWKHKNLIDSITVSYQYKIKKPDKRIFQISAKKLKVPLRNIIHIGDSYNDDYTPKKYGLNTLILDRHNEHPKIKERITSFKELDKYLETNFKIEKRK